MDIGSILNRLDDIAGEEGGLKTYGLMFIKKDGKVGRLDKCRKSAKNPKGEFNLTKGSGQKYNLKEKGAMKLYDENLEQYRDIKVATIFAFKNHGTHNWLIRSW